MSQYLEICEERKISFFSASCSCRSKRESLTFLRCIKFFRKARYFSTHPRPYGGVRENRKAYSHARDLVFMHKLIRVSNGDSKLRLESKRACSTGELC